MVVQEIKDGSEIREYMVTEKQGCGDGCDTRESRKGPEMGVHGRKGRSGEIQGRSIDWWEYGVQECRRRRK